jgi:hypothetical protein
LTKESYGTSGPPTNTHIVTIALHIRDNLIAQ